MNNLKIGYAESLINPKPNVPIGGYYVPRFSKGILSDLKAISLAIKSGDATVLIVSVDNCHIKHDMIVDLKNSINKATGMMTATLTFLSRATGNPLFLVVNLLWTR